jgi:hypothetical protein
MSAPVLNFDYMGSEVQLYDWVLQTGMSSNAPALKFCKVVGISKAGRIRVIGFQYYKCNDRERAKYGTEYVWLHDENPYSVTRIDKTLKIKDSNLPDQLMDYIWKDLKGDVRAPMQRV